MLSEIIPPSLFTLVEELYKGQTLNEIRIRNVCPIIVNVSGVNYYLTRLGLSANAKNTIIADINTIESIIAKATRHSIYAYNSQIKQGFISHSGIRIGIAGEIVEENGIISTIKNITSLNIRIPNKVKTQAHNVYSMLYNANLHSTLIISPPGVGKTSFLRDLALLLSEDKRILNVSVIDERGELAVNLQGVDIYLNSSKEIGFVNALRSMRPDIIITDEIGTKADFDAIERATTCGIIVIASMHANDVFDLQHKRDFSYMLDKRLFTRYVVLSNKSGIGTIDGIYNEKLENIF